MSDRRTPKAQTAPELPRSAALGFYGFALLALLVPVGTVLAISPWSGWGFDGFARALPLAMGAALLGSLPLGFGYRRRRGWWVNWFRWGGSALLLAWLGALMVALLYPLGLVAARVSGDPSLGTWAIYGLILLIVAIAPAICVAVALRSPYWWQSTPTDARRRSPRRR